MRLRLLALAALGLLALWLYSQRAALRQTLFDLTGEESAGGQARAMWQLATDRLRPPLNLKPETPIAYNGVNPFGVNTFLQQEVEPSKRELQMQMLQTAGFQWLRQEFPWYDLEVHGKGNFEDCRNDPCVSAWAKYDQIVSLAEQYGLTILTRLSSPPAWSRAVGNENGTFAPPDHYSDFADYAAAVAERYRGRLRYYQVWNEPNNYPEWGNQPVDPEGYTRLLCETYARIKAIDPDAVIVSGVLAPTNDLGADNGTGGNSLNDFIYLQRMYNAGAKQCFDVLTVQGYGLWSGPTDHRLQPLVVNFGRNQFIRDLMVANGDEHKAIWIAEMNWNAVPEESGIAPMFGRVTLEQQARYAPLAYERAQGEWPWVGAIFLWYFKDADDHERDQPKYYFRMIEPDFTPLPVYTAMQAYARQTPVMRAGWYQEEHWAVTWDDRWATLNDAPLHFGRGRVSNQAQARATFDFEGTSLTLNVWRAPSGGRLLVRVDGQTREFNLHSEHATEAYLSVASGLSSGQHHVELINLGGRTVIDGFIVREEGNFLAAVFVMMGAVLVGVWRVLRR